MKVLIALVLLSLLGVASLAEADVPSPGSMIVPTYSNGFARFAGESARPGDWEGLKAMYMPSLGPPSGNTINNLAQGVIASAGSDAVAFNANMDPTNWTITDSLPVDTHAYSVQFNGGDEFALKRFTFVSPHTHVFDLNSYPITLMAMVDDINQSATNGAVIGMYNTSAFNGWVAMQIGSTANGGVGMAQSNSPSGNAIAFGTTDIRDGRPHFLVAVLRSETNREVFVDGVSEGTDTTSIVLGNFMNSVALGRLDDSSPGNYFIGRLLQARIYGRDFTPKEILEISQDPYGVVRLDEFGGARSAARPQVMIIGWRVPQWLRPIFFWV